MRAENATKKVDVNNWTVGMKVDFDKETSEYRFTIDMTHLNLKKY